MPSNGIFCLEGEWEERLTDKLSVRPGLDMLMTMRKDRLIHRNAATSDEFAHYFTKWTSHRYSAFPLAYLAFHGRRGKVALGRDDLSLTEIADLVERPLTDRVVYFGSCETLGASDAQLAEFVARTGVRAVVGYTRQVYWSEAAAFDLTLLPELLDSTDPRKLYNRLTKRHPYFVDGLGLRIATATWVSPRRRSAA
ncbi:DUF6642 family protein [Geodermatophilus sp. SYSU D01119]